MKKLSKYTIKKRLTQRSTPEALAALERLREFAALPDHECGHDASYVNLNMRSDFEPLGIKYDSAERFYCCRVCMIEYMTCVNLALGIDPAKARKDVEGVAKKMDAYHRDTTGDLTPAQVKRADELILALMPGGPHPSKLSLDRWREVLGPLDEAETDLVVKRLDLLFTAMTKQTTTTDPTTETPDTEPEEEPMTATQQAGTITITEIENPAMSQEEIERLK